ncbi:MAG: hypothetical protein FWF29_06610 [Treponema sp.]|nr:hypothetical protein [Treponema sp.]
MPPFQLLQHINLVGRPCGVFSTNEKTIKYLSKLIKASEAKANEPLLLTEGPIASAISKWVKTIPASNF